MALSLKSVPIKPLFVKLITSHWLRDRRRRRAEKRRRAAHQPHLISVYLRLNDPHSYLLLQVLEQFAARYPVEFDFRTVLHLQPDMYPAPTMWEQQAFADCAHLASLYNLEFPAKSPAANNPDINARLTAQLLHWELQPGCSQKTAAATGYLQNALQLFHAYWQGRDADLDKIVDRNICDNRECYNHHLEANQQQLKQRGHYLTGMLHYGGEWYWGLNRLEHLEQRFNEMGLAASNKHEIIFNLGHSHFCQGAAAISSANRHETERGEQPITMYWSIRSPYSYLALVRARQLAAHYDVPLEVKPVLPMVMRRMQVPKTKGFYILADTKREADKYGIDFGYAADPLGAGVERCYALFDYAQSCGLGLSFLQSYASGVWAEGIASETDSGLQKLVERAGMDWRQARSLLNDDSWRIWAQDNLAELYGHGLWGVPSLVYGETKVFGQDRLDRIEQAILSVRAAS